MIKQYFKQIFGKYDVNSVDELLGTYEVNIKESIPFTIDWESDYRSTVFLRDTLHSQVQIAAHNLIKNHSNSG